MLEQLFGSKTRVKLLQLFLANSEKKYYIREITRLLDCQINSVRREVENLASFGILKGVNGNEVKDVKNKKNEAQKKYFQANLDFPLFSELKSLILRSHLIIKKGLLREILKAGNIYYLALAGIFVDTGNGPVDIFIVGKVRKDKIEKIISKFEKELNRRINYTLLSKTEFNYRKDVTDRFIYEILEGEKIVVVNNMT
jgi:hypothetical protein